MKTNFAEALRRVLIHEGGYANHPRDPGGPTNKGVTQRVYDAYRKNSGKGPRSVRQIEAHEVAHIYLTLYADKIRFDDLPRGVDYAVFDAAVNSGPAQAAKWLQRELGVVVDGVIGPATVHAVNAEPDKAELIRRFSARRMAFLRGLRTFDAFGAGWTRRVSSVQRAAIAMLTGHATDETYIAEAETRAPIEAAKPRPSKELGDAATGAGVATGTVAGTISQAQEQLAPLAGGSDTVATIVAVLALTGVVLVAGGLGWRWWQKRRAAEHADALDLPREVAA